MVAIGTPTRVIWFDTPIRTSKVSDFIVATPSPRAPHTSDMKTLSLGRSLPRGTNWDGISAASEPTQSHYGIAFTLKLTGLVSVMGFNLYTDEAQ